uniref:Uncharacterized protein n=1 Tax=Medicago truncatula TaxID=3880 RepID=A2Q1E5_MEDTR|nr:hypothetical protein MtrDRAFT_AC148775g32v2 [Medicago truncatula]
MDYTFFPFLYFINHGVFIHRLFKRNNGNKAVPCIAVENEKERIEKLMVGTVTKILEIYMGIIHNKNNEIVINTRDHKQQIQC